MYHFSTDRLAGLDNMILRIAAPPTLIVNHVVDHDIPARKLRKRTPLAVSNNVVRPHTVPPPRLFIAPFQPPAPTTCMLSEVDPPPRAPDQPVFRPLPPLPSASSFQLPSFLDFSDRSFTSAGDPPPRRSAASLPASALFRVSPPPSRRVVARKAKVFEGPQWIPAFHHPNSPYVPWSSPVRRRILPPSSPLPSPVCPSPCIRSRSRSGAVAPEPWSSSTFSQAPNRSAKERISSSWKSFKNSVKRGVKTVVSRLGKSKPSLKTICIKRDTLSIYDDPQPNMRSNLAEANGSGPRDSLASFVSSDSTTLATWLAERRVAASHVDHDAATVGDYELNGSWLDLRHSDGGWLCGVQDCDMHTVGGSPVADEHPDGLRMAMPFDCADLLSATRPSPKSPAVAFPAGLFSAPPRFHSLPRLPCQCFDIHSAQHAKPAALNKAERCLTRGRELSMPGGWTFS